MSEELTQQEIRDDQLKLAFRLSKFAVEENSKYGFKMHEPLVPSILCRLIELDPRTKKDEAKNE